jgi:hypothetical protein
MAFLIKAKEQRKKITHAGTGTGTMKKERD